MNHFVLIMIIGMVFITTLGTASAEAELDVIEFDEKKKKINTKTATFALG